LVHINKEKGMMPQTNIKIEQERFAKKHLAMDISVSLNPWWHTLDYIELCQTCDFHLSPCATSYNHIKPTFQRRKCMRVCVCVCVCVLWCHVFIHMRFFLFWVKRTKEERIPCYFGSLGAWHLPWKKQVTLALINFKSSDSHRRQGVNPSNKVTTWVVVIRSVCYFFFPQGLDPITTL
jgi:hypothetical protein